MIIIKTNNGDVFVNEKTTHIVEHNRENKTVVIRNPQYKMNSTIHDVEGIIYTNDAQPTSWKDEGSEIQRMKKLLDEQRELIDMMRDEHMKMILERDELKERLAQLEPKPIPTIEEEHTENYEQLSPETKALLSQKVEELDLSVRTRNLLKANGIDTILDLCRLKKTDCLNFRNGGKKSFTELDDFLTAHNLTWGMDV